MENENTCRSIEDGILNFSHIVIAILVGSLFILIPMAIWENTSVSALKVEKVNAIYAAVKDKPEKSLMDEGFLEKVRKFSINGDITELEYDWVIEHNPLAGELSTYVFENHSKCKKEN